MINSNNVPRPFWLRSDDYEERVAFKAGLDKMNIEFDKDEEEDVD